MARHSQIRHGGNEIGHTDKVDVAARHLVYNLFVAMSEMREASQPLREIDEHLETLARAMERGWVEVFERRQMSGAIARLVALTEEGRRIARRSFH